MKTINHYLFHSLLALTLCLTSACTDKEGKPTGAIPEHQIKSLEKANNIETELQNADLNRRRQIDET